MSMAGAASRIGCLSPSPSSRGVTDSSILIAGEMNQSAMMHEGERPANALGRTRPPELGGRWGRHPIRGTVGAADRGGHGHHFKRGRPPGAVPHFSVRPSIPRPPAPFRGLRPGSSGFTTRGVRWRARGGWRLPRPSRLRFAPQRFHSEPRATDSKATAPTAAPCSAPSVGFGGSARGLEPRATGARQSRRAGRPPRPHTNGVQPRAAKAWRSRCPAMAPTRPLCGCQWGSRAWRLPPR